MTADSPSNAAPRITPVASPLAWLRYAGVTAVGLGIDLWSKSLAWDNLSDNGDLAPWKGVKFIPGWLHFEFVKNHGAVFGIGQNQVPLFIIVAVLAVGLLTWMFARSGGKWFYQILLGILLAGVLGNLYDRVVYGFVRDMLHALPRWPNVWPWVFNVADVLLCSGVGLMLAHSFFARDETQESGPDAPAAS
jgi:signal peptidase II